MIILLNKLTILDLKKLKNKFFIFSMLNLDESKLGWDDIGNNKLLSENHLLGAPELLFSKIEDEEVTKQIEKLHAKKIKMEEPVEKTITKSESKHGTIV